MNIIIPYTYEANDGLELKFALRSIDKYLLGHDKIYLIGDKFPKWLQNVEFINVSESSIKEPQNILKKLLSALRELKTAVQWQDDIYLTNYLTVGNIKYWADGTLEDNIKRSFGSYKNQITNTALKITESVPYFDIHTPIIYEYEGLRKLMKYDWSKRYLVKTLYSYETNRDPVPYKDCKVNGPHSKEEILKKIKGSLFFSTSPQSITPEMIEVLTELYPKSSIYEVPRRMEQQKSAEGAQADK